MHCFTLQRTALSPARRLMIFLLAVFLTCGAVTASQAAVWYVRQEAAPGGDGTSWHSAFNNLAEAIAHATSWDEIWVKRGIYYLDSPLVMSETERMYGGFEGLLSETLENRDWRGNETVIDGQNSVRGIQIAGLAGGDGAVVDGFTIRNCRHTGDGGAVYVGTGNSPILRNCTFTNNAAQEGVSAGGGVCIKNDVGARIISCTFRSNTAIQGGAVYGDNCSPVIVNCVFHGNSAVNGGAIYHHNPTPVGGLTRWNSISNCTFYKNTAENGGAIYITPDTIYNIYNTILWGNTAGYGSQAYYFDGNGNSINAQFGVNHSCVQGGTAGLYPPALMSDGSWTDQSPGFFSPDYGDFRLRGSSTDFIDTGRTDAPYLDWTYVGGVDLAGEDRWTDGDGDAEGVPDLGAYEYLPGGPQYITWHVDGEAAGTGTGWSWDAALDNIAEAAQRAINGDEIWVKQGTYTLSAQISVNKSVHIYGGFSGTETQLNERDASAYLTVVNGNAAVTCFHISGGSPMVDGFTVTNGNDGFDGGGFYIGGASPTISNCIVTANTGTSYGGGFFVDIGAAPTISNCQITHNQANHGGGIYSEENCIITIQNSVISGNQSNSRGGGVYIQNGTLNVTGSQILENEVTGSHSGGGICVYNAALSISGCAISQNKAVYTGYGYGAGIAAYVSEHTPQTGVHISDCQFVENQAYYGGGLAVLYYGGQIAVHCLDCEFIGNQAGRLGGAVYGSGQEIEFDGCTFIGNTAQESGGAAHATGSVTYKNCFISQNQAFEDNGGGIYYAMSDTSLINCTVICNHAPGLGGGIFVGWEQAPTITNSIVWGNTAGQGGNGLYIPDDAAPAVSYSNLQSAVAGTGNISQDPLLAAATDGHLSEGSPCIDAADDSVAPAADIERHTRFGSGPDMGAYEYQGFTPVVLDHIEIGGPDEISELSGSQFNCTAHYSDGSSQDVTGDTVWTENSAFTAVSSTGYLAAGDIPAPLDQPIQLSARFGYQTDEHTVTIINDNPVSSLEIIGPYICTEGAAVNYTCLARLADGSAMDVTDTAAWENTYPIFAGRFFTPGIFTVYGNLSKNYAIEITASFGGRSDSRDVDVLNNVSFSGVEIVGPAEIFENDQADYECRANYSNGESEDFTAYVIWSENSDYAQIDGTGRLLTETVPSDQTCGLAAVYYGTSDTHAVLIKKRPPADFFTDFDLVYEHRVQGDTDVFSASDQSVASLSGGCGWKTAAAPAAPNGRWTP